MKPNKVSLNKYNFGDVKSYELTHKDFDNLLNEYHHYRIDLLGNSFKVYMDNELLFEANDPLPFMCGAASLYSYRCKGSYKSVSIKTK